MFPFLIGRIRTEELSMTINTSLIRFPFLIGRIRTAAMNPDTEDYEVFPFLIGRIRTYTRLTNVINFPGFHSS